MNVVDSVLGDQRDERKRRSRIDSPLNSDEFTASGGRGLMGLAKDLLPRCRMLLERQGARLPK